MSDDCSNNAALDRINGEVKRRRGRPKGSKNKTRSQTAIAGRSIDDQAKYCSSFRPHLLEIPEGYDVARAIVSFARGHSDSVVCVLSASGPIAEACICFSSSSYPVLLTAPCQLLSITAVFLPGGGESMSACFGGLQGQAIWGRVVRQLVAAGKVAVVVATFGTSTAEVNFSGGPSAVRAAGAMEVQSLRFDFPMEADNGAVVARGGDQSDIFKTAAAHFPGGHPSFHD